MKKYTAKLSKSVDSYTSSWAKRAPKNKAGIFGFTILLELFVLLPELLISLPLLILLYSFTASLQGTAAGDASTLPGWFNGLLIATALFTLLLICILQALIIMTTRKALKKAKKA